LAEEEEKNTGERYCESLPNAQVPEGDAEGVTRTIWANHKAFDAVAEPENWRQGSIFFLMNKKKGKLH
jgi:hypothetical protein